MKPNWIVILAVAGIAIWLISRNKSQQTPTRTRTQAQKPLRQQIQDLQGGQQGGQQLQPFTPASDLMNQPTNDTAEGYWGGWGSPDYGISWGVL